MNQDNQLKVAKLATKLIVDFPKATNDLDRLKWMKTAIELLNLKQTKKPDPVVEPTPETEKEEAIYLKKVISKSIPDIHSPAVGGRISEILKYAHSDDKDLFILGQKAVDTYKEAFLLKAKKFEWGKV